MTALPVVRIGERLYYHDARLREFRPVTVDLNWVQDTIKGMEYALTLIALGDIKMGIAQVFDEQDD